MKVITTDKDRFRNGAKDYAAYLGTFEGRLRTDLAFANLEDRVSRRLTTSQSLSALDVGGGTGTTAVRLASLGLHVTLLDSSKEMLEIAQTQARKAGVENKVALQLGDAMQLASLYPRQSFDAVLCHNILEYLEDPMPVLRGAARALRDSSALLSILVRNQSGEVLKSALQSGDLVRAKKDLSAEWGQESLYGGKVRLFTPDGLRAMLKAATLVPISEQGVRVLADYLPPRVSRSADYSQIFDLERQLSVRPEFAAIARYTQYFAHNSETMAESSCIE